jgi:hypothetical protein
MHQNSYLDLCTTVQINPFIFTCEISALQISGKNTRPWVLGAAAAAVRAAERVHGIRHLPARPVTRGFPRPRPTPHQVEFPLLPLPLSPLDCKWEAQAQTPTKTGISQRDRTLCREPTPASEAVVAERAQKAARDFSTSEHSTSNCGEWEWEAVALRRKSCCLLGIILLR